MAQQQNNISITAPGFLGLNTQDSPLDMDQQFASIAENCVIDKFGRISARKGIKYLTTNPAVLGGNPIIVMQEFLTADNASRYLVCAGNNKLFVQQLVSPFELVELTLPALYTITADNWSMATLNDKLYIVQAGHQPLLFEPTVDATAVRVWAEEPPTVGVDGYPNVVHAAFGRLWTASFDTNSAIVYWSGLLNGEQYTAGGSGSIATEEFWPQGYDRVNAITGHNNFLVVFGQRNILLYQTTSDVDNTISLVDTIESIGCIAKDSVQSTGTDLLFVDSTGVRSLNRTIQEKSVPIGDISINVRDEFQLLLQSVTDANDIKGVFNIDDGQYVVFLPPLNDTYVFDTRRLLPNGGAKVTLWRELIVRCGQRFTTRVTRYGGLGGIYEYTGNVDIKLDVDNVTPVTDTVKLRYFLHPLDFGSPSNLLFPKQVDVTVISGNLGTLNLNWGFDFKDATTNRIEKSLTSVGSTFTWGGTAEWDSGIEWTSGTPIAQLKYNVWGQGRNIQIGFDAEVAGDVLSIQEVNIQALSGRIL